MRYNYNQCGNSGFQGANIPLALTFANIKNWNRTELFFLITIKQL